MNKTVVGLVLAVLMLVGCRDKAQSSGDDADFQGLRISPESLPLNV